MTTATTTRPTLAERVLAMRAENETHGPGWIAERVGTDPETVRDIFRDDRTARLHRHHADPTVNAVLVAYRDNQSLPIREIAAVTGITPREAFAIIQREVGP